MRIIAGQFKSRRLAAPKGMATRPTTDRIRESIFNLLTHGLGYGFEGKRIIDLFAGSGALGFEALSRGAAFALFVETSASARGAIRDNVEALGLFGATRVHRRDATKLGPKPAGLGPPFDIAFLDPPYRKDLAAPALAALKEGEWLKPSAIMVVESGVDDPPPELNEYSVMEARNYGETRITILGDGNT